MQKVNYSELKKEAEQYWQWAQETPIAPVPPAVAREGAGSELRTPLMHYGTVMPVYLAIIRYLRGVPSKKGLRLIELGCGSGRVLTYLKILFPELEVWGVDYSKAGITYAKETYGKYGVKFKHTTAQQTTLKSNFFDFVISSHVIEHVTKEEGLNFINETHRLLKKNGHAFIGTPERRRCQELYMLNPTDAKEKRLVPPHEHEYTLPELKSLGQVVFPKDNVRVDLLVNPVFHKVFKSSIDKFRPDNTIRSVTRNMAYRNLRDKAPRPFFDFLTRIGATRQLKALDVTFHDILVGNVLARDKGEEIPDNLLLVCQK